MNTLKDQLSVVVKAQLDFQQKIENQMSMLQTMMQTVCQLVNNEIITNKKCSGYCSNQPSTMNSARSRRDTNEYMQVESRPSSVTNIQKPRTNSTDELISFAQRMSNGKSVSPFVFNEK